MKLSMVVPCFNEEENVCDFYECAKRCFDPRGFSYEIVFVDDGSNDDTLKRLKSLTEKKDGNIKVVSFSRNFGKEAAIYAGLSRAKGDMVCIIDADLQQRPEVVLEMMDILDSESDLDCVAAYQKERKENSLMSAVKSGFYKIINKISEVEFVNGASDFRLMRRSMVKAVLSLTEYYRFSKGIFSWVGFKTKYIPYEVRPREHGKTKWGTVKLIKYAFEGIAAFSTVPLKFAAFTGFLSSLSGVIYLVLNMVKKAAWGYNIPVAAVIITLILLVGGLILLSLGIIGGYLAKMYVQLKNRPIYIEKIFLESKREDD